jgi:hypothetical protein
MSDPEIDALIGAVAAKHGILLKPTDAAFALVTINQILLERSGRELTAQIDARLKEFEVSFERLQVRAGRLLAREVREAVEELRELAPLVPMPDVPPGRRPLRRVAVAIAVVCGAGLFGAGIWCGVLYCS